MKLKKTFVSALLAVATWGALSLFTPQAQAIDCSLVRCPGCPDGYVFKPTGNNCCRCVPAH